MNTATPTDPTARLVAGLDALLDVLKAINDETPYRATKATPANPGYVIDVDWIDEDGDPCTLAYPAVLYAETLSRVTGHDVEARTDYTLVVIV